MKNEAHYENPVNLFISKSYDDAETAQEFIKDLAGEQLSVSKGRNGDYLYVSIEGADEDIDAFLEVYKDEYDDIVKDCGVEGWVTPEDAYYASVEGKKELLGESQKNERDNDDYLQEVWDSLVGAWDKDKFDMGKGYDSEYDCECITITSKDNEEVRAKIYIEDYEGRHPVAFNVVYRYPGDKGVGVMGTYEFQSTDMDGIGEEVFDYFDEIKQKVGESMKSKSRFGKMVEGNATDYDGKYYVDIEDEDEDTLYSSDMEFDSPRKASLWAFDELEKCKDDDDVFQASVYQLFINDDGDLDHELVEVIPKSDVCEAKKSEGLPPKKLGSKRQYRSRADLINKMKQLGAVEITTSKQFNDIKNSQWLHTAGYALDTNGNLVAQSYYGDKDGKWYYTSTRNFDSDYLPESKQHENHTKEEEVTNIFKGMKEWADRWSNSDKDRKTIADNLDLEAVQENMSDIVEILDNNFEWDGYGFKFVVVGDYEDDDTRDEADANKWDRCYGVCEEIADLIGIPDEGHAIGEMNIHFWEEIESDWRDDESKPAESKKSEADEHIEFKQTEFPKELRKLYQACSERFYCEPYVSDMLESSRGGKLPKNEMTCDYTLRGSFGSDVILSVNMVYRGGAGDMTFTVTVSALDETTGRSWKRLGDATARSFDDALNAAMSEVDKNLMPFAVKVRSAKKGESKKSESGLHNAYYAKALQAVDRAIKMTHGQFDITGDVSKFDADLKTYLISYVDSLNDTRLANIGLLGDLRDRIKDFARGDREEWWKTRKQSEAKKSKSTENTTESERISFIKDLADKLGIDNLEENRASAYMSGWRYFNNNDEGGDGIVLSLKAYPWARTDQDAEINVWLESGSGVIGDCWLSFDFGGNYKNLINADKILTTLKTQLHTLWSRREGESKKSESLTLKQKELKDMARFGQAEDITTISDEEAKALRKKGIETIGISRGVYGMNGALLRDNEGNKYVITARSSNLFYFV